MILADPGMGKSTLLAYLALVFAGVAPLEGFACPPRVLPIHISLRELLPGGGGCGPVCQVGVHRSPGAPGGEVDGTR